MTVWEQCDTHLRYQLGDITLWSKHLRLQSASIGPLTTTDLSPEVPPSEALAAGVDGFAVRALPTREALPTLTRRAGLVRYVQSQYDHCTIDLTSGFDSYKGKFSSKTRSTIQRKIRKFSDHCGGALQWREYRSPEDFRVFFPHAVALSKLTYQERLLDVGIPASVEYFNGALELAANDQVRGYLLFDGERPVSYLFCPVKDGVLIYAYLGYDPAYLQHSVGTVLQWVALESMFNEKRFRAFDFTEGESEHKRLFSTERTPCANILWIRDTAWNRLWIHAHHLTNRFSSGLGDLLDRLGLRVKLRKLLRFGRAT